MAILAAYAESEEETETVVEVEKTWATFDADGGTYFLLTCGSVSTDDLPTASAIRLVDDSLIDQAPRCEVLHHGTAEYRPVATLGAKVLSGNELSLLVMYKST